MFPRYSIYTETLEVCQQCRRQPHRPSSLWKFKRKWTNSKKRKKKWSPRATTAVTEVRSSSERTNPTTSPRLTAENPKVDRRGTLISNNWGPLCFRYCVGPVYSGAPFNLLFPHIYMYFFLYFICLGRDASGHVGRDTFEKKKMNKILYIAAFFVQEKNEHPRGGSAPGISTLVLFTHIRHRFFFHL